MPVLDDSIQRNFQFPVFVYDFAQFVRTFVAFTALPEAQCPERIQRGLSGQVAYSGYDSVGVAAVDEVVVGTVAYFRVEGGFLRIVEEVGRRVIVKLFFAFSANYQRNRLIPSRTTSLADCRGK